MLCKCCCTFHPNSGMKESSLGRTESPPVSGWFGSSCLLPGGMDHGTAGSYRKKSVILLGLTIRQIELPGFRKKTDPKEKNPGPWEQETSSSWGCLAYCTRLSLQLSVRLAGGLPGGGWVIGRERLCGNSGHPMTEAAGLGVESEAQLPFHSDVNLGSEGPGP